VERFQHIRLVGLVVSLSVLFTSVAGVCAASRAELNRQARAALNHLCSISRTARRLGESASGVLVFPDLDKDGGNLRLHRCGTLFDHGRVIGYYKAVVASYSLPKRIPKFEYALFFMSDDDLTQLRRRGGWEIGTGTDVVVVEENQKRKEKAVACNSASANQIVTIARSAPTIVAHASQVTHRPAMNDQQEAAPRPNDLTLNPTYGGFIRIPNAGRSLTTATRREGVYAFAFDRTGLINGAGLQGAKITPIDSEIDSVQK
jgi:hypothetical protein